MTNFVPSNTIDDVIDAVSAYLNIFQTVETVRGNVSRVPMPNDPFIQLTEVLTMALNKPIETYYNDQTVNISEHTRIDIQVDFFGWEISDLAKMVHGAFRTVWSVQQFPAWLSPLYCSYPQKVVIQNAEDQFEQRWIMTMSFQYNPDFYAPAPSFTAVLPSILNPVM